LAPTFSNLYPEILDPAGVSEPEFRRIIEKLNGELVPIFSPNNWRNIVDGVLGLLTGWVWDDFGLTNTKSRLRHLESWIEKWNTEMEKTVGSEEGTTAPRIIPLRRTGYMNVSQPGCPDIIAHQLTIFASLIFRYQIRKSPQQPVNPRQDRVQQRPSLQSLASKPTRSHNFSISSARLSL
jgi:hypothetical protein